MTTLAKSHSSIFDRIVSMFEARNVAPTRRSDSNSEQEDARNEREFVTEMLTRNADAFASEMDVQNMMQLYSGRF